MGIIVVLVVAVVSWLETLAVNRGCYPVDIGRPSLSGFNSHRLKITLTMDLPVCAKILLFLHVTGHFEDRSFSYSGTNLFQYMCIMLYHMS